MPVLTGRCFFVSRRRYLRAEADFNVLSIQRPRTRRSQGESELGKRGILDLGDPGSFAASEQQTEADVGFSAFSRTAEGGSDRRLLKPHEVRVLGDLWRGCLCPRAHPVPPPRRLEHPEALAQSFLFAAVTLRAQPCGVNAGPTKCGSPPCLAIPVLVPLGSLHLGRDLPPF